MINKEMFYQIESQSIDMSWVLADDFGKTKHAGARRHSTLQAVAPTTSSSFILGQVSPSIEPLQSKLLHQGLGQG